MIPPVPDPAQPTQRGTTAGVYVAVIVALITIAAVVMSVLADRGILTIPGTTAAKAAGASSATPSTSSTTGPESGSSAAPATETGASEKSAKRASHASASASAPATQKPSPSPTPEPVTGHDVAWIGDSVSASATGNVLKQRLPGVVVNAQVGRSSRVLASEIQALKARGQLGNVVVVELGANGVALESDIDAAMTALGPHRQLILVTPHGGADNTRTTKVYTDAERRLPKQIQVADWNAQAYKVKDFAPDGIHIGGHGAGILVDTVAPKIAEAKARLK
ncbi:MAG: hypothetical protein ACTMIK_12285 [Galactobacter sp.]